MSTHLSIEELMTAEVVKIMHEVKVVFEECNSLPPLTPSLETGSKKCLNVKLQSKPKGPSELSADL